MDRGAWKLAIHVPEPWLGFEILWVSTLAYPNLFGTERLCCCCWTRCSSLLKGRAFVLIRMRTLIALISTDWTFLSLRWFLLIELVLWTACSSFITLVHSFCVYSCLTLWLFCYIFMIFWQIDIAMRDNAKNLYATQLKSIGRGRTETQLSFVGLSCILKLYCAYKVCRPTRINLDQGR